MITPVFYPLHPLHSSHLNPLLAQLILVIFHPKYHPAFPQPIQQDTERMVRGVSTHQRILKVKRLLKRITRGLSFHQRTLKVKRQQKQIVRGVSTYQRLVKAKRLPKRLVMATIHQSLLLSKARLPASQITRHLAPILPALATMMPNMTSPYSGTTSHG